MKTITFFFISIISIFYSKDKKIFNGKISYDIFTIKNDDDTLFNKSINYISDYDFYYKNTSERKESYMMESMYENFDSCFLYMYFPTDGFIKKINSKLETDSLDCNCNFQNKDTMILDYKCTLLECEWNINGKKVVPDLPPQYDKFLTRKFLIKRYILKDYDKVSKRKCTNMKKDEKLTPFEGVCLYEKKIAVSGLGDTVSTSIMKATEVTKEKISRQDMFPKELNIFNK